MSDIRYVILSDLHLGQDSSILTHLADRAERPWHRRLEVDPTTPAPALVHLLEILAELIGHNQGREPPVLVLLGNTMELALAETHVATTVFQGFASLWQRDGESLFSKVLYLPGNRDHQLWEHARGAAYADYLAHAPLAGKHRPAQHTTSLVRGLPDRDGLLGTLVARALGDRAADLPLEIYYPNLALRSPSDDRLVLLHHGHYAEPLYRLVSTLSGKVFPEHGPLPPEVEEWEKENHAWIDFLWSALGRSGLVGADVEQVHEILADERKLEAASRQSALSLLESWQPASLLGRAEKAVLDRAAPYMTRQLLSRLSHRGAHAEQDNVPGQAWLDGLRVYVEGPLINQAHDELGPLPDHIGLVMGHTHQPFERIWDAGLLGSAVELYNTGGWAVAPDPRVEPRMGGAAVLLDRDLHAASLRFFNQAEDPADYRVRLTAARTEDNPLYRRLSGLVDPAAQPYAAFSRAAATAVERRIDAFARFEPEEHRRAAAVI